MSAWPAAGLALALALVGYGAGWLSPDGVVAATLVGAGVFAGCGLSGAAPLGLFFVSGSLLTAANHRAGLNWSEPRGPRRGARQVLANGLWAAAGAGLVRWNAEAGWALLTGSLATAQADTWSTEFGAWARTSPRLISTWAPVPRGTSGGVTGVGTLGGLAGGLALAGVGALAGAPLRAAAAGLVGGLAGMLIDSVLGATLQRQARCETCGEITEQAVHRCGRPTRLIRGWRRLDNDGVNLLAAGAGGSIAVMLMSLV